MTLHDHIYSNFNISISFKPSITFAGSTGNLGSVRGRSLKAGRIRRLWRQQCLVKFSTFPFSIFLLSCSIFPFFLASLFPVSQQKSRWGGTLPSAPPPSYANVHIRQLSYLLHKIKAPLYWPLIKVHYGIFIQKGLFNPKSSITQ